MMTAHQVALDRMLKDANHYIDEMRKDYSMVQRAVNVSKCSQELECYRLYAANELEFGGTDYREAMSVYNVAYQKMTDTIYETFK